MILPPGYVQGILNKVFNNVSLKIENIIVKYVEDDMVCSVNLKSFEFYSADADWKRAFTELTLPDLLLRKVCEITDVTICLDQQNSSGRIEFYQDPILYKCNLTCRILSKYKNQNGTKAVNTKIDTYSENCDFSVTDQQIPMLMRLLNLTIALFYGTLDLPGCNSRKHAAPDIIRGHKNKQKVKAPPDKIFQEKNDSVSWTSWAWSFIPGFDTDLLNEAVSDEEFIISFGVYATQISVTLKRTNQLSDAVISNQRLEFTPLLCFELAGYLLEFISIGGLEIDLKCSVQNVIGFTVNNQCACSGPSQVQNNKDSFDQAEYHNEVIHY